MLVETAFCLDDSGYVGTTTVYSVVLKNDDPEFGKFVLGLLNSSALEYFHKKNTIPQAGDSTGIRQLLSKVFQSATPVLDSEIALLRVPTESLRRSSRRDADADTSALEREIDQLVYALYGLTPEEIKLVDETVSRG